MPSASDWELIDDGSWNGIRRWSRCTDDDYGTIEVRSEGIGEETIIEQNKRSAGVNKRSELWHVGHIPASVGLKWLVEKGVDIWNPHHSDAVAKLLMDSDYRHLVPGCDRIML